MWDHEAVAEAEREEEEGEGVWEGEEWRGVPREGQSEGELIAGPGVLPSCWSSCGPSWTAKRASGLRRDAGVNAFGPVRSGLSVQCTRRCPSLACLSPQRPLNKSQGLNSDRNHTSTHRPPLHSLSHNPDTLSLETVMRITTPTTSILPFVLVVSPPSRIAVLIRSEGRSLVASRSGPRAQQPQAYT